MKHLNVLGMLALLLVLSVSAVQAGQVTPPTPIMSASSAPTATGTIAYVVPDDTTGDQVWLVQPDGSNKRKIYSTGKADPYAVEGISSMAWRPDSGEIVFAANHEQACSWFAMDLFAIRPDGSGYRRVTNAPDCAALANYPKGSVKMSLPYGGFRFYIMGLPELFWSSGGPVTINNVADLGDFRQPVVAIDGLYRAMGDPVDVKAPGTVDVGIISFYPPWNRSLGAWGPVWRSDGSKIGYTFGCAALYEIADQPPVGTTGKMLLSATQGPSPCAMAWGPTPSTASDIVYWDSVGDPGIYRTTETSSTAGTKLIATDTSLLALRYLPDGSGLLFTMAGVWADSSNLYRYDFGSGSVTQLTNYTDQFVRDFAISPDGQKIVFELAPYAWGELWGGFSDLYMMGMGESTAHLFVAGAAHPSWSLRAPQVPPSTTQPTRLYLPLLVR